MKVTINLQLNGEVLEHDSLIADLFIVRARCIKDDSTVVLSYHIDRKVAEEKLEFYKEAYSKLYKSFYIDDCNFIVL